MFRRVLVTTLALLGIVTSATASSDAVELAALGRVGRRPLANVACSRDSQCPANQFCLHPALSAATGSCSSCWRCCLFPDIYGECPERCACTVGVVCESRSDCGRGLFCSREDPWDMPKCQRCDACTDNAFELAGSCSASCPSADMAGLASLPHLGVERFLFLSFLAQEISTGGAYVPEVLLPEELGAWLQGSGLGAAQANGTVASLLGAGADALPLQTWMTEVSDAASLALLCPAYDPRQPWTKQPPFTMEGCFCNATRGATTFRCPAGQRCSPAAYRGLETDALLAPTAAIMRAVCVPCGAGQYCPEGTYVQDETDLASLDCPSGSLCPTPSQRRDCPPGSFCPTRSTSAITCNYETLLKTTPYMKLPLEPETVVVRLRDRRDPLRGNYCPARSVKPYEVCEAGYYCPDSSTRLVCPKGYFCKAQSTAPWKCTYLTNCPEGTTVPKLSYMALVIAGVVIVGIPLIYLLLTQLDKSVMVDADDEADREREAHRSAEASRMTYRLLKSMKLTHNPLSKYRGFDRQVSPLVTLEFESLGLQLRPRGGEVKTVLAGVSGSFVPKRLNAILGPSGCGKTTFLNVLCGKISNGVLTGQVKVNGEDIPITALRNLMGFVPQDDIVHEDLTVRENLHYSARLRLPSDMDRGRRSDVVRDALEMLGLTAIRHYRVGTVERRGISGGQRKRVNIGLELVAMPSLLFLDEPTSGLDATSAADVLNSLVDMANMGMNIIMVIHGPRFSSYLVFDQVLLLGPGGRTVYLGSPSASMLYFTTFLHFKFPDKENPSDMLMDIIAGKLRSEDKSMKSGDEQVADLVARWTEGGSAWVDMLEALNPTMVTKMSDVDAEIIEVLDEEFDALDPEGRGFIHSGQLVTLFSRMGQDISLDDAVAVIRKINANRPASARSAMSVATADVENPEAMTVTKQQLMSAFQGIREGKEGSADPPNRNAAAKFYASQFVLPDLDSDTKARREEQRRRMETGNSMELSPGASPAAYLDYLRGGSDGSGLRVMGGETLLLPQTVSQGGSSGANGDHPVDSDSYSPVTRSPQRTNGGASATGNGNGSGNAQAPVAEAVAIGDAGNRTVRARALPPGYNASGPGTATGTDDSDGGDLTAYAQKRRWRDTVGEDDDFDPRNPTIAPGLVATSLAAMEALARADVPMPALPRRVSATEPRLKRKADGSMPSSRSDRRSTTFAAIAAYVNTYNELAAAGQLEAPPAAGASAGNSLQLQQSVEAALVAAGRASGAEGIERASSARAVARRTSAAAMAAAQAVARRSGATGEGDMWGAAAAAALAAGADANGALREPAGLRFNASFEPDGYEHDSSDEDDNTVVPPLLAQLLSVPSGGVRKPAGPVAEGTEPGAADGTAAGVAASDATTAMSGGDAASSSLQRGGSSTLSSVPSQPGPALSSSYSLPPFASGEQLHNLRLPTSAPGPSARVARPPGSTRLAMMTTAETPPGAALSAALTSPKAPSAATASPAAAAAVTVGASPKYAPTTAAATSSIHSTPHSPYMRHTVDTDGGETPFGYGTSPDISTRVQGRLSGGQRLLSGGGAEDGSQPGTATRLSHASTTGVAAGRTRRGSQGAVPERGRKQRRQSWAQVAESSFTSAHSGETGTPGGGRKKKDTLYVNSLLSNALVGAWAATQSVTAGRMNQSMARIMRLQGPATATATGTPTHAGTGGGAGGGTGEAEVGSVPGTPPHTKGMGRARSQPNMPHPDLASKVPSSVGLGGAQGLLARRLDLEEKLAERKGQGFFAQLGFLLKRGAVKYVRSFWPMRVVDTVLQLAAAFIIGLVHGTGWGLTSVPSNAVMCMVCLGVLSCVTHLRTFSQNRVLLWREASSGMSLGAYYISQNVIDQLWVFTAPALALGVYYYLTLPRMPFSEFYVVGLFVCWWASGMAYLVSAVLPPQNVLMAGVFISLIFGAFLHGLSPTVASARGTLLEGVLGISYNRWAMEIVTINEMKYYQDDMRNTIVMMSRGIGLCGVDQLLVDDGQEGISASEAVSFLQVQYNFSMEYCNPYKSTAYGALVALGLGFRVLAFVFLWHSVAKRH
ncbi:hypothetical protein HYH03_002629 [Edaphochlamys debaryana]|uniref:Uncharacterized protein n=1 Tax=Edaphochlamys debaryana TaxID=47281 RepID=A0A835YDG1_9CHLO|nr:hypothetical protein HYH03_002629 [Edaphochlamys debaryana]|eukprot:KAG2499694.1 hypothetical protein HYH03_002629 [Edaphochlamys debaryana]